MTTTLLFPLPVELHIGFVVVASILMALCFIKRRRRYELLLIIGIISTLFVYVCKDAPWFYILGIEEIALFVLACVDMHKVYKALDKAKEEKVGETEKTEKTAEDTTDEDSTS